MTGPLLYLTVRSVWNRGRVRLTRLRQPRYLAGLIVGGLYFYWFLFGQRSGSGRPVRGALDLATRYHDGLVLVGAVALLVVMTLVWVWPGRQKLRIAFTQADIQFLLTAPIARADLIRYKVLRAQVGVLFGAAVMTLFFRPGSLSSGWTFWVGMTMLMAAVNVHLAGVSLYLQPDTVTPRGRTWASRWPRLILIGSCGVVLAAVVRTLPMSGTGVSGARAWFDEAAAGLAGGLPGVVLWPWKALVELPLSVSASDFFRHLPPVLGILVLNYFWVTRSQTPFEEAAAETAERRTSALAGPQPDVRRSAQGGRVPFRLAPTGRPEVALLWKNLLMMGRYVSAILIIRIGLLVIVAAVFASRSGRGAGAMAAVATLGFIAAIIATFLGPQIVRNDLRQDLAYLETLKQWPLRGAEIVRGEVLTPVLLLTAVVWFVVPLATALGRDWRGDGGDWLFGGPWSWAVSVMLVAAGLILVQVITHNALAVAFPAWARIGGSRAQGIDVMGQRMLLLAGTLAAVSLAALPAALVGALVGAAIYAATGTVPVLACAFSATVALLVEALLATEALGALLDRTDVTALDARD